MDKLDQLKTEYAELSDFVELHTDTLTDESIENYILSAMLKIWGGNRLYSPDYARVLAAVSGAEYTLEQIITAMSCCADEDRKLSTPAFFDEILEKDLSEATTASKEFIERLSSLLVSTAFINGDFTIAEANALSEITDGLMKCCDSRGLRGARADIDVSDKVTEMKDESYLKHTDRTRSNTDDKPESGIEKTESESSEPLSITLTLDLSGTGSSDMPVIAEQFSEPMMTPATQNTSPNGEVDRKTLDSLLAELDSLVGLGTVKRDVHSLMNFIKVSKIREQRGMKVPDISYHLVFTGNPGTGKTTVARLVAQLYYQMGILPQGQLVETDRSALVAGYLGQTALKTQKVIQQALGGVLFIDEAYSLAGETDDSYGREAVETLLKAMEDHRDELVVIVAGYDELMHKFINSNPGLASRFGKYFYFPDYTGGELLDIFLRFCSINGYKLADDVSRILLSRFELMYDTREEHFGNARTVRNIFEKSINAQADRISAIPALTDADLETIVIDDINNAMEGVSRV